MSAWACSTVLAWPHMHSPSGRGGRGVSGPAPPRRRAVARYAARLIERTIRAALAEFFGWRCLNALVAQAVQMGDEIAHMSIVHRALRFGLPCVIGRFVVGKDANDMEVVHVLEHVLSGVGQFAPENKVQALSHVDNPPI